MWVFNYYGWLILKVHINLYCCTESRRTGRRGDLEGVVLSIWSGSFCPPTWASGWGRSGSVFRKNLLLPFGESISPLGLLLPHLGGIFSILPHSSSSAPSASSLSSELAINASIIGRGRVDGVGCVNDSIVPHLFPTFCSYSCSSSFCIGNKDMYRGGIDVEV